LKRRSLKRRGVPESERRAVAAEIALLLKQRDKMGRRVWTQASIGEACGGLSQQMIFIAQEPDGVGPNVRDGVLRLTGLSTAQLLKKHGIPAEEPPVARTYERPAAAPAEPERSNPHPGEGMTNLRRVIRALQDDGYDAAAVKLAVADLVFGDEITPDPTWDALDVYRRARARLERDAAKKEGEEGDPSEQLDRSRTRRRGAVHSTEKRKIS
jgi:hypothetical protein